MTFWIQQGWGKGSKVEDLASRSSGVILSPADEPAVILEQTALRARAVGLQVAVDPQTFIHSIPGAVAERHLSHGLAARHFGWGMAPAEIEEYVEVLAQLNTRTQSDFFIAPSAYQGGFNDAWSGLALQFAAAAARHHPRVFMSLVIDETALSDWNLAEYWLDVVTRQEFAGLYVIVGRTSRRVSYPFPWETRRLVNFLRLLRRLAINRFEVIVGFSDVEAPLLIAAGATGVASGWSYKQRAFIDNRWVPQQGGRQPANRLFLPGWLNSPLERECQRLGDYVQQDMEPEWWERFHLQTLTRSDAQLAFLSQLAGKVMELSVLDPPERLNAAERMVAVAQERVRGAQHELPLLDRIYERTLETFSSALAQFRALEAV